MIVKTTAALLLASGKFTLTDLQEGRAGAKTSPNPYVIGFTPGGARVEVLARHTPDPMTAFGRVTWRYTYRISGYTAAGDDLSLFGPGSQSVEA
jgi:hypothetical protein